MPLNVIFVWNFLYFSRFSSMVLTNVLLAMLSSSATACNSSKLYPCWSKFFCDTRRNIETYTLHLVATWPNTCDSYIPVLRNTFSHLEVFVLITYRYPLFWVLPKRCSETPFDSSIRFCFYKAIRTLCLRKKFVATEMIFRTFARTDPMQCEKMFFDRLYRSLYS